MNEKTIYALGFFDGVHLGHQALLHACRELAAEAGVRADENAQQIGAMADQIAAQLAQLQQLVISSKTMMQETAVAMFAIAPQE
jgi:FAD synthase